jgi:hypothetical protein
MIAPAMAKRTRDLGAQATLYAPARTSHALAFCEFPRGKLADTVDHPVRMVPPEMDLACAFTVSDGAVSTFLSLFHGGILHRPPPSGART